MRHKYFRSIYHDLCSLTVLLTITTSVEIFSMKWCWQLDMPQFYQYEAYHFFILDILNNFPNYTSADDAATCLSMLHMVRISPLSLIGSVFICILPNIYLPKIIDRNFYSVRYDASYCIIKIMLYMITL